MNIDPSRVIENYEQNLNKGNKVSCFGVLKLLSEILDNSAESGTKESISLRDRLYTLLGDASNKKLLLMGQNYMYEEKPRDALYKILLNETNLANSRLELIKRALRGLETSEKDVKTARERINIFLQKLSLSPIEATY